MFMSSDMLAGFSIGTLVWLLAMGASAVWRTFRTFITPPSLHHEVDK